mmetsp:Transcript_8913/g.15484  ORF Transcript_8913/g.15484 Transcript_8913/m.15484 type:complete len:90 (-) Transcript_8913:595-864(-)
MPLFLFSSYLAERDATNKTIKRHSTITVKKSHSQMSLFSSSLAYLSTANLLFRAHRFTISFVVARQECKNGPSRPWQQGAPNIVKPAEQ